MALVEQFKENEKAEIESLKWGLATSDPYAYMALTTMMKTVPEYEPKEMMKTLERAGLCGGALGRFYTDFCQWDARLASSCVWALDRGIVSASELKSALNNTREELDELTKKEFKELAVNVRKIIDADAQTAKEANIAQQPQQQSPRRASRPVAEPA